MVRAWKKWSKTTMVSKIMNRASGMWRLSLRARAVLGSKYLMQSYEM